MNITNKRVFWYSFSVSLVVFLTSEWWVSSINFYLSNCITAICTFAMTFICLEHFKVDGKTKYLLVCTVSVSAMLPCPLLFIIIPLPLNQNQ